MKITILACDPGVRNFAYSIIEYDTSNKPFHVRKVKVLQHGVVGCTVTELKSANSLYRQRLKFGSVFKRLKRDFKPTHSLAERFMSRGFGGGASTAEKINFMIGVLHGLDVAGHPLKLIGASVWKNEVKRNGFVLVKARCNGQEVYEGFERPKGE